MNKPTKKPRRFRERKPKAIKLRCFIGIKFSLATEIDALRKELAMQGEKSEANLRLVPDDNLHVTLKFIGSIEESRLGAIDGVMKQVAGRHKTMSLEVSGVGLFKNSFWVGVEENPQLSKLANELNLACLPLDIATEEKAYMPHVTVARFNKESKAAFLPLREKYANQPWGKLQAESICLYRSDTLPEGAKYTVIDEAKLGSA